MYLGYHVDIHVASTTQVIEDLLFTPKFRKKNAETRSFQDCVNQEIDCIRIDIS